jgi:hypothetical protein
MCFSASARDILAADFANVRRGIRGAREKCGRLGAQLRPREMKANGTYQEFKIFVRDVNRIQNYFFKMLLIETFAC